MDPVYDSGRAGAEIGGGGRRVAGRKIAARRGLTLPESGDKISPFWVMRVNHPAFG